MATIASLAVDVAVNPAAAITGIAALGVTMAGASLKMAGDFQQGMTTLVTGAGEAQGNLKMVSDGILQMAVDTGTSTKQLTDGMFMIESAGFHGAAGLKVLQAAAEGAKVGNASLASVANGVTTEMVDYAAQNLTAAQATNILVATVANGKTHMEDLANSLSAILPAAAAVHVSIYDVSGALADMTAQGTPAANAATYLRQLLLALAAPAHAGAKALSEIGLTTKEVSDDMKKSLPDTLKLIMDHLAETYKVGSPQYVEALKAISGGSKQMQGMLQLTGSHLQTLFDDTKNITGVTKTAGDTIQGWSLVQQNFNFQVDRGREVLEKIGITLGTKLLPYATQAAEWFTNNLAPAFNQVLQIIDPLRDGSTKLAVGMGDIAAACKAIVSPFDDGSRAIDRLAKIVHPLIPKFDEGSVAANKVALAAKSMVQPFDEGSRAIARLGNATHDTKSPFEIVGKVIKDVATFARTTLIPALMSLGDFILNTVVPALGKLWDYAEKNIIPVLTDLATYIEKNVVPVLEKLAVYILTNVVPVIEKLVAWFLKNMLPVLKQLWTEIATNVIPALESIWDKIANKLIPAVQNLWEKLSPVLIPILHGLGDVLKNVVGPAISGIIDLISTLVNWFSSAIDKAGKLFNFLGGIKDGAGKFFTNLGSALPHFADGGTMPYTGWAKVGERGPEVVRLPSGSQVYSNNSPQTQAALNGNTAQTSKTLNVNVYPAQAQLTEEGLWREIRWQELVHG